jgi:DNA-binding transcriptional LysR family regulator
MPSKTDPASLPYVLVMLDPVKLATLAAVVEHGSFSAAGAALSLSQPAVSRHVGALEARLGTPLLVRARDGVRPTSAGTALLAHAEAVLGRLRLAEREVADLAGLRTGEVRLGSFLTALVHLSSEVGTLLDAAHPALRLRDALLDRPGAFAALTRGEVDVAFVFEHPVQPLAPPDDVELVDLFADPVRLLLPVAHPLAAADAVAIADLAAEPWVRPHEGSAARLHDAVTHAAGIAPPLVAAGRGDEPLEAQALVAAGRGVLLGFALTVVLDPARIALRPLRDPAAVPARRVQAAVLRGPRPPATRALLDAAVAVGERRRRERLAP